MKICVICRRKRDLEEFRRLAGAADGHLGFCMQCERLHERLGNYHISVERFIDALEAQGWCCVICGIDLDVSSATVDHDHSCCVMDRSCGKCVRGFPCASCNAAMGLLGDSWQRTLYAAMYLAEYDAKLRQKQC